MTSGRSSHTSEARNNRRVLNPFVDDDIPQDAQSLVLLGTLLGVMFSGMLVLFIAGEMLSDPGGVQGLLMVMAWLALPAALSILALVRPRVACPILTIVVAVVLLASLLTIPFAQAVWEFEDSHGPINLVVLIGVLIPLVFLGRAMPGQAGWLMIAVIAGSVTLQAISLGLAGQWSVILVFGVLMPPFIAVAIVLVLADARARRDSNPQPTGYLHEDQ
jgi:hypothetical protein